MSMSVSMSLGTAAAGQACGARAQGPKPTREDAAALAEKLFDKLDTQGSGALKLSDLQAVAGSDAEAALQAMDGDGDGSVSKAEFSSALEALFSKLDDQMTRAKLERAGGPPPPPPPGEDQGLSEDEIAQMLEDGAGTDGKHGELLQRIADDFAAADADGNGRVTREEAMKLDGEQGPDAAGGEDRMLQQILKLMSTYGASQATASTIEETA